MTVTLRVITDPGEIAAVLDPRIAADPVRGTILGTIRAVLSGGRGDGWCVVSADGRSLALRSDPAYPVVLDGAWPGTSRTELATRLAALPDVAAVSGPVDLVEQMSAALPPARHRIRLRLFRLDSLTDPAGVEGTARRAAADDRALLVDWYRAFAEEAHGRVVDIRASVDAALDIGGCWLWLHPVGRPVALATRQSVVGGSSRIGPVYTPPAHRGHGYGSAVTAAATRDILSAGVIPVLFTDLSNPTSNRIYPQLGYTAVEDRLEIRIS